MVETRFYDLLVLLTKNSRFSNSSTDIKHPVSEILKGNNIIFVNQAEKINAIKELIVCLFLLFSNNSLPKPKVESIVLESLLCQKKFLVCKFTNRKIINKKPNKLKMITKMLKSTVKRLKNNLLFSKQSKQKMIPNLKKRVNIKTVIKQKKRRRKSTNSKRN